MCVSYAHFNFFPYRFQLNENAKALCLYCTNSKNTNIFVKVIQWDKLWYDFPVFTVSHYGEQAVSFKMVELRNRYLSFRHQYVCVNSSSSDILPVYSGVPQGSVLGPLLVIVYVNEITMTPLSDGTMSL